MRLHGRQWKTGVLGDLARLPTLQIVQHHGQSLVWSERGQRASQTLSALKRHRNRLWIDRVAGVAPQLFAARSLHPMLLRGTLAGRLLARVDADALEPRANV